VATTELTVTFESPEHEGLHKVLVDAGFTFSVHATRRISTEYQHDRKRLIVNLTRDLDGEWDATVLDFNRPVGRRTVSWDDYNDREARWLDASENSRQFLMRELYILLTVRPMPLAIIPNDL
jgi:hypothetical protein